MYKIVKILEKEFLDELLWTHDNNLVTSAPAGVMGRKNGQRFNTIDTKTRSTKRVTAHYILYPELCKSLEDFVNDGTKVNQFDFLIYEVGDHFCKHCDVISGHHTERYWSTITLLDKSDDLEGGELNLYVDEDNKETVEFDIGETVIFRSNVEHEVLPVTKGVRKVLVAWLIIS